MNPINLIIGCGYLGTRLLGLLNDQECYFTNRSEKSASINDVSNEHSLILDINNKDSWKNLDMLSEKLNIIIYFMVTPRQIERTIFPDFIKRLNQLNANRAILISSTVVYGNVDRIVDADTEVNIDSERAERQYLIEQDWLGGMENGTVVRLAGIYGPERVIGKNGIINREAVSGDPDGWLNLIHVNDGARLVKRISEVKKPEQIELGCDGYPIKRHEYYSFLARALKQSAPKFNLDTSTRSTGRRCDNKITMTRTGWQPEQPNFRKAISNLIT
jgi:nucleoside-diphosphate-sugar epimerase